jgi:dihydrofolate reductase
MSHITCHMSISVDGFVAGPDQSEANPLGVGGRDVHLWHIDDANLEHPVARAMVDHLLAPKGAYIMGRNMFGPVRGPWEGDWRGWWGEEPPYHAPVFVLTHHERDSVEMAGGTTFHFVTGGFDEALARAREAAGDAEIDIAGGASTVRQALAAGVIDELVLDVAPVLLGEGERMFDASTAGLTLELVEAQSSPYATHVRYGVSRAAPAPG